MGSLASAPTVRDLERLVSDIKAYIEENHATTAVPVELIQQGDAENLSYALVIGGTRLVAKHLHTVDIDGQTHITPKPGDAHGQDPGLDHKGVFFTHTDNGDAWAGSTHLKDPLVRYIMAQSIENEVAGASGSKDGYPGLLIHKGARLHGLRVSGQVDSDGDGLSDDPGQSNLVFVTGKKPFAEIVDRIVTAHLGRPLERRHGVEEAHRLRA
jgi:hypothetical protein